MSRLTRVTTFVLVLIIVILILPPAMVMADEIEWPDLEWMDGKIPGFLPLEEGNPPLISKYPDHLYVKFPYKDGEGSSLRYFYLDFTYKEPDIDKRFDTEINGIQKQIQFAETYKDRRLLLKEITANSGFYAAIVTINKNESWAGRKVLIYRDSMIILSSGGFGWQSDVEFYNAFSTAERYAKDAIDRLEGNPMVNQNTTAPFISMFIQYSVGRVEIRRPGEHNWAPAPLGTRVTSGTEVRTLEDGHCELDIMGDEAIIRMDRNSHLLVPTPQEKTNETIIELILGTIWLSVKSLYAPDLLRVRTLDVVASVKGTEFEVSFDGSQTTVYVIKGEVEVADPDMNNAVLVKSGQTTTCASGAPSKPVAYETDTLDSWWLIDYPSQKSFWVWLIPVIIGVVIVILVILIKKRRSLKQS